MCGSGPPVEDAVGAVAVWFDFERNSLKAGEPMNSSQILEFSAISETVYIVFKQTHPVCLASKVELGSSPNLTWASHLQPTMAK